MIFNIGGAAFKPPVLNPNYPADVSVVQSSSASATFQVVIQEAGEPAEYAYQWYVNNSPVSGATSASYTKTNLSSVGTYIIYCTVTHPAGVVTSRSATLSVLSAIPGFTYSGSYEMIEEGNGDWRIKLKTSGVVNFSNLGKGNGAVDIFCVGGGAGGNGHGGGGGYTSTTKNKTLTQNTNYTITVGAGGSAGGGAGGQSSVKQSSTVIASANGGVGGVSTDGGSGAGGNGGSGRAGNGGSNGGDGSYNYVKDGDTWYPYAGGKGQGTTTREFGESSGTLYSGGGGGGSNTGNIVNDGGFGGDGGGGHGSWTNAGTYKNASAGGTNTGGGGGGGQGGNADAAGGSGIVVIRNKR